MLKKKRNLLLFNESLPLWMAAPFLLILWQILLWAQNPGLMSDDSGEMIAASYCLGLPHPPGYPIFCLLGRLFSFIPIGTVAFRFNLLASLVALISVYLVMDVCAQLMSAMIGWKPRSVSTRRALMILVGISLFFCRTFFAQALTAKGLVYLMTLLNLSALIWMRVRSAADPAGTGLDRKKYFVLFLCFLGFDTHWQTQVLILPFIVFWFYQDRIRWTMKSILVGGALSTTTLSLYLYLPLRASLIVQPKWGDPVSLSKFIWVVTRKLSSRAEFLIRGWNHYALWIGEYFRLMTTCWLNGFWVLGLIGILFVWRRNKKLFWSFCLFYFSVLFGILAIPRDETIFLMNVYLLSVHGLFVSLVFLGLIFLAIWVEKRKVFKVWVLLGAVSLALIGWGMRVFNEECKSRYTLAGDFGMNVLKGLSRNAVFLVEGDHYVMPLWYWQYAEKLRPDLSVEPSIFLLHDWGWRQLSGMDPDFKILEDPKMSFLDRFRKMTEGSNRHPVFYSLDREVLQDVLGHLPGSFVPLGLTYVWARQGSSSGKVFDSGWEQAAGERLRGVDFFRDHYPVDVSTKEIYRYYADQYFFSAQFLYTRDENDLALKDFDQGLRFYSVTPWVYSNMAVIFGKKGYLELSRRLCLLGIAADPRYLLNYMNLANSYVVQKDYPQAKRCYELALALDLDRAEIEKKIVTIKKLSLDDQKPSVSDKTQAEYGRLAERFEKEGLFFLSGLAFQVAGDLKPKRP